MEAKKKYPISWKTWLPFGKHKGKPLDEVPTSYLVWWCAQDSDKFGDLKAFLRAEFCKALGSELGSKKTAPRAAQEPETTFVEPVGIIEDDDLPF